MNLNLHLLKDLLCTPDYQGTLNSDPLQFPLEYPALCREYPVHFSEGILYIMPAEAIPEGVHLPSHSSVICAGDLREKNVQTDGDLLFAVSEEITCEEIMNLMAAEFHRYQMWESYMVNAVKDGNAFGRMAAGVGRLLGNPVEVWEASVYLLCFYFPEDTGEVLSYAAFLKDHPWKAGYVMSEEQFEELITDREYLRAVRTKGTQIYEGHPHGFRTLYQNVILHEVPVARICVSEVLKPVTTRDEAIVSLFTGYMAEALSGRSAYSFGEGSRYLNVVHGMIEHKLQPEASIQRFLAELGWQEDDEYVCLTVKPRYQDHEMGSDLAAFSIRLGRALSSSCYLLHEEKVVIVCNLTKVKKEREFVWRTIIPMLRDNLMTAGVSTSFFDFRDLYYFYRQAGTAQELGIKTDPDQWVFRFEDYQIAYLLEQYKSGLGRKALIPAGLMRLMQYDKEKNTEYIHTLRTYLNCACSAAATTEKLHLHRNSLGYRLERIESMTGMSLSNADHRLILTMALWLLP